MKIKNPQFIVLVMLASFSSLRLWGAEYNSEIQIDPRWEAWSDVVSILPRDASQAELQQALDSWVKILTDSKESPRQVLCDFEVFRQTIPVHLRQYAADYFKSKAKIYKAYAPYLNWMAETIEILIERDAPR